MKGAELIKRAKDFESRHGCGSIGGCVICLADFAADVLAEREAEIAEMSAGFHQVGCVYGSIYYRTSGRSKGKYRAVSSVNFQHIKGVFDSQLEAWRALKTFWESKQK